MPNRLARHILKCRKTENFPVRKIFCLHLKPVCSKPRHSLAELTGTLVCLGSLQAEELLLARPFWKDAPCLYLTGSRWQLRHLLWERGCSVRTETDPVGGIPSKAAVTPPRDPTAFAVPPRAGGVRADLSAAARLSPHTFLPTRPQSFPHSLGPFGADLPLKVLGRHRDPQKLRVPSSWGLCVSPC